MSATSVYLAVAWFSLVHFGVEVSSLPNNTTAPSSEGVCTDKELVDNLRKIVSGGEPVIRHLGVIPGYAATSCQQIADLRSGRRSGYYWIQEDSGPARVYCEMEGVPCGEGVWMQVADVNTTQPSSKAPSGLVKVSSPRSLCRRNTNSGCSSSFFSTHNVSFSRVCGLVIAYQYKSPDAFNPYYSNQALTIDDLYVDGVSITHSSTPRQHIWTLAAAQDETHGHSAYACPCTNYKSRIAYPGLIPEFIGNDFYCETASRTSASSRYYLEDPLWDGKGCGQSSSCCEGDLKPWFSKDLGKSVSSDIEVRVCTDSSRSYEDILIETISLYVQ